MSPTDIGNAYDRIVHLWTSDEFDRHNGIPQHQKAIAFASKKGRALDLGCGCTGRFIDLLVSEGFAPEGVDISGEMIRLARIRNPGVTFHHVDIMEWNPPAKYDFISAWDSLWHIPLDQQEAAITKIVGCLEADGILIFSFGGLAEPGEHTDNHMGPDVYYSSLGTNGFLSLLIKLGCTCKHLEFDQYPELHAFLIVQKQ